MITEFIGPALIVIAALAMARFAWSRSREETLRALGSEAAAILRDEIRVRGRRTLVRWVAGGLTAVGLSFAGSMIFAEMNAGPGTSTTTVDDIATSAATFSDDFESCAFADSSAMSAGGIWWYERLSASGLDSIPYISTTVSRSGSCSVGFMWGWNGSETDDGSSDLRGKINNPGLGLSEWWAEWWIKIPSNYLYGAITGMGGGNNKWAMWSYWDATGDKLHSNQCDQVGGWMAMTEFQGPLAGNSVNQSIGKYSTDATGCFLSPAASSAGSRFDATHGPFLSRPDSILVAADTTGGVWTRFRYHGRLSSATGIVLLSGGDTLSDTLFNNCAACVVSQQQPYTIYSFTTDLYYDAEGNRDGTAGGVYEGWMGDNLMFRTTHLPLGEIGTAGVPMNVFQILGWWNMGMKVDTYLYLDDVKLYAFDPGW